MSRTDKDLPLKVRLEQAGPTELAVQHDWRCQSTAGRHGTLPCGLEDSASPASCRMVLANEALSSVPARKRSSHPRTERRSGSRSTRRALLRRARDEADRTGSTDIQPDIDELADPRTGWFD